MIEAQLIAEITRICGEADPPVRWIHLAAVRLERCPHLKGYPDLHLVGSRAMCWRELKTGSTRLTAAQESWLDALEAAGADVGVWTELDLNRGVIRQEILALNGVQVDLEPWIPPGASDAEAAHRRAYYGT